MDPRPQPDPHPAGDPPSQGQSAGSWDPCAAGEIAAVGARQRQRSRRRRGLRGLGLGLGLLAIAAAGLGYWQGQPDGGTHPMVQENCLDCPTTLKHLPQYHAKTLSPETTLLVDQHLADCPGCQKKFDQWLGNVSWIWHP